MKSISAKNIIDKIVRLCEEGTAKQECYKLFFSDYGEFVDDESYWEIAYRAQDWLQDRPSTVLKKEGCRISEGIPQLEKQIPFEIQESYISVFDSEQKKNFGIFVDTVSVYEGHNRKKYLKLDGKLNSYFAIDCELDIKVVDPKNKKLATYEYIKLVTEDKGTYIVDVLLPVEKKTIENVHKVYIFCRYR